MKKTIGRLTRILFASFWLSACSNSIDVKPILDSSDVNSDLNPVISSPNFKYDAKFYSGVTPYEGQPTPMVIYTSENGRFYYWLRLQPLGDWSRTERAQEVARRLDTYRIEKMDRISWGKMNNQNIICAYTEAKSDDCQIIVTVPKHVDPEEVLVLLQCKWRPSDNPKCSAPMLEKPVDS